MSHITCTGLVPQVLQSPTQGFNLFALPSPQTLQKSIEPSRVPHILEILKDFFFCLFEKRNTKLLFVMTQKNKTQLNPIPQGTAQHRLGKQSLLWSSRCRPGSLVPWGLQGGTPSQGGPWQPLLLLFRIRHTAPFPPGSLLKCSLFTQTWGY